MKEYCVVDYIVEVYEWILRCWMHWIDIVWHYPECNVKNAQWGFWYWFIVGCFVDFDCDIVGVFILSHFRTKYVDPRRPLSVRQCVWVCLCVCLSQSLISTNLFKNLRWQISHIWKKLIQWRHNGFFICFSMRHSHVFSFCAIFF